MIGAAALLALGRGWKGFALDGLIAGLFILACMTYHLVSFERGRDQAGTDFTITLAGRLYLGFIGAYLISLRQLPEGLWWVLAGPAGCLVGRYRGILYRPPLWASIR